MKLSGAWDLLRRTISEWQDDKAQRLGASLAFYTVFSLPPLLLVVVMLVGLVFHGDATSKIEAQMAMLVNDDAARAIGEAIRSTRSSLGGGVLATTLGIGALLFGATGVFAQLQDAMNTIWEVQPRPGRGWRGLIFDRILSFGMVLGIGFLLLVSLVVSAAIAAIATYFGDRLPGIAVLGQVLELAASFVLITTLFALIFKFLPDADTAWRDVWLGAAVTAVLFEAGKVGIGIYLGRSHVASTWGAAGAVLVLLLWVYYSAQILFFGAEFTQVFASTRGAGIIADAEARPVTERRRAQQGLAAVPPGSRRRRIDRVKRAGGSPDLGAASWGKGRTLKFLALLAVLTAVARRRG
jgi:membrane protein